MYGIQTEVEQTPEESADRRPEVSPQDPVNPARQRQDPPFSPDPMQRTDRYRLVTPYRLARED